MRPYAALLCCALVGPVIQIDAQQPLPPLPTFHGKPITLTAAQVAAIGRGETAIQLLEASDPRDVAVFGMVAVNVPRAFWVGRLTDFAHSLGHPGVAGFGVFGTPASPSDVGSLTLTSNDVAALRKCRPGSCQFKLPASEMARARRILDSAGASGPAEVSRAARKWVADYVNAYRERGNSALVVYDDRGSSGVRASDALTAMMAGTTYLTEYVPALAEYLSTSPGKRPSGATEVIYWTRQDAGGMRPTLTISHLIVYSPAARPQMTVAVTKQLYANHYFEGALDVLAATPRPVLPRGEGIYVILLRQHRFDHLPGGGILNLRARVRAGIREHADAELRRMRTEYQAAWARRP